MASMFHIVVGMFQIYQDYIGGVLITLFRIPVSMLMIMVGVLISVGTNTVLGIALMIMVSILWRVRS